MSTFDVDQAAEDPTRPSIVSSPGWSSGAKAQALRRSPRRLGGLSAAGGSFERDGVADGDLEGGADGVAVGVERLRPGDELADVDGEVEIVDPGDAGSGPASSV
jgi:hypothetical protein